MYVLIGITTCERGHVFIVYIFLKLYKQIHFAIEKYRKMSLGKLSTKMYSLRNMYTKMCTNNVASF